MKKIITFVSIVLFVVGCGSCNKVDQQNIEKNSKKMVYKQPVQPGLSPGTVLVEATTLTFEKDKNSLFLIVDKVISSGHSVPDLAVGEKIHVRLNNEKFNNQIKKNNSLRAILKYSMQKVGETNSNAWHLINIK